MKRLWLLAPGPGTTTGTGTVFVPNPVHSTGDESLTDQKDSDAAVPASAYYRVALTSRRDQRGLRRLLGDRRRGHRRATARRAAAGAARAGEVHDDGRIWSRALYDIRQSVGHVRADTVILQGQINFDGTTMTDLASRTVAAAQSIYGNSVASKVRAAFEDRGIL